MTIQCNLPLLEDFIIRHYINYLFGDNSYSINKYKQHKEFTNVYLLFFNKDGIYCINKKWYDSGELAREENYKDGKKHGLHKAWYNNGELSYELNYLNGELHGLWKLWFKEIGKLCCQANYQNGKEHGSYKRWYENGQLFIETSYKNGKKHGPFKKWSENGQLIMNYFNEV